eukprot:TRINITY_DN13462_c0_g1_i1.p1 TRINITY_DN13462_c0_g1~~TRINITY_DN13462_c0_g1_i1.p1  ORF type:complete len:195 (+),score=22.71 TRINITY_DN13462_c0_g1_i1:133-717(+)
MGSSGSHAAGDDAAGNAGTMRVQLDPEVQALWHGQVDRVVAHMEHQCRVGGPVNTSRMIMEEVTPAERPYAEDLLHRVREKVVTSREEQADNPGYFDFLGPSIRPQQPQIYTVKGVDLAMMPYACRNHESVSSKAVTGMNLLADAHYVSYKTWYAGPTSYTMRVLGWDRPATTSFSIKPPELQQGVSMPKPAQA